MGNVLKMERKNLIQQLLELGWSYRRIQRETGHRRETIARYDPNHPRNQESKAAKVPADSPSVSENRPECPPTTEVSSQSMGRSSVAPYHEFISQKLELGLTAQRIYQDLCTEHGFTGSYGSVKRYVRKLKKKQPKIQDYNNGTSPRFDS